MSFELRFLLFSSFFYFLFLHSKLPLLFFAGVPPQLLTPTDLMTYCIH